MNFRAFVPTLAVLFKKESKWFFDKADSAAETLSGEILHQMEVVINVEAIAARKLSKESSGNTLLYLKGKHRGKYHT